jgi:AbrB family looped-hinge helix DNA binding protein
MATTHVSSKGQIIIPKTVRESRRWAPGTRLEVRDTPEGVLLTQLTSGTKTQLRPGLAAIRARIGYKGPAKTIEEMDAAVLSQAALRKSRR